MKFILGERMGSPLQVILSLNQLKLSFGAQVSRLDPKALLYSNSWGDVPSIELAFDGERAQAQMKDFIVRLLRKVSLSPVEEVLIHCHLELMLIPFLRELQKCSSLGQRRKCCQRWSCWHQQ